MKRHIQSVLNMLGYRIVRAEGLPPFFTAIRRLGFAPRHIVDIGANHGSWTRTALRFFPDAFYTLVEPQDHLKVHVQDLLDQNKRIRWISAGASDHVGSLPFTIAKRDDSSTFILSADESRKGGLSQIDVPVTTLNAIAACNDVPFPDMVKIDAEGFDLKVLAGSSDLFGKTEIFLAEASVCCPYPNSVVEMMHFMTSVGYRLIDITDLNRSPRHDVLWLCELAFLRNSSQLLNTVATYE